MHLTCNFLFHHNFVKYMVGILEQLYFYNDMKEKSKQIHATLLNILLIYTLETVRPHNAMQSANVFSTENSLALIH